MKKARANLHIPVIKSEYIYIIGWIVSKCHRLRYRHVELHRKHRLHLAFGVEFPYLDNPIPCSNYESMHIPDTCVANHAGDFAACPQSFGDQFLKGTLGLCQTTAAWVSRHLHHAGFAARILDIPTRCHSTGSRSRCGLLPTGHS